MIQSLPSDEIRSVRRVCECPLRCEGLGLTAVTRVAQAAAVANPAHRILGQGLGFSLWGEGKQYLPILLLLVHTVAQEPEQRAQTSLLHQL